MALIRHTVALTGAQTAGLILDPTTGKRFVLHRVIISATVALNIRLIDETDTDAFVLFRLQLAAATPFVIDYRKDEHSNQDTEGYYRSAAINNKLECVYAETSNAFITIEYDEE